MFEPFIIIMLCPYLLSCAHRVHMCLLLLSLALLIVALAFCEPVCVVYGHLAIYSSIYHFVLMPHRGGALLTNPSLHALCYLSARTDDHSNRSSLSNFSRFIV